MKRLAIPKWSPIEVPWYPRTFFKVPKSVGAKPRSPIFDLLKPMFPPKLQLQPFKLRRISPFKLISTPLFFNEPWFNITLAKPLEAGNEREISKSLVFFWYTSTDPDRRLLKKAKSKPTFQEDVRSHFNPSFCKLLTAIAKIWSPVAFA